MHGYFPNKPASMITTVLINMHEYTISHSDRQRSKPSLLSCTAWLTLYEICREEKYNMKMLNAWITLLSHLTWVSSAPNVLQTMWHVCQ